MLHGQWVPGQVARYACGQGEWEWAARRVGFPAAGATGRATGRATRSATGSATTAHAS